MSRITIVNATSFILAAIRSVGDSNLWLGQFTYEDFDELKPHATNPTSADHVKVYVRACLETHCQSGECIAQILPSPIDKLQLVVKTHDEFRALLDKGMALGDAGNLEAMFETFYSFFHKP